MLKRWIFERHTGGGLLLAKPLGERDHRIFWNSSLRYTAHAAINLTPLLPLVFAPAIDTEVPRLSPKLTPKEHTEALATKRAA